MALLVVLLWAVTAHAVTITVTFDDLGLAEGDTLTDELSYLGVEFSSPGGAPLIAEERSGEVFAYYYGSSTSLNQDEWVVGGGASGGFMLTDPFGDHARYPMLVGSDLEIRFTQPVTEAGFYILDVDASETFTIKALSGSTVLDTFTIASGDPGAGDGIGTWVGFTADGDNLITSLYLESPSWAGYAIDDVTFTVPDAAAVPAPATIVLVGAGLLGMVGLRRKKK